MRSVEDNSATRLYRLGQDGMTETLLYGSLGEALARAAAEPAGGQGDLFLQTRDDVVAYLDLIER